MLSQNVNSILSEDVVVSGKPDGPLIIAGPCSAESEAQVVSIADLYGGKICAALDRQHPRDLFDVMLLLENEGITREIRQAFIVYLVSHCKP